MNKMYIGKRKTTTFTFTEIPDVLSVCREAFSCSHNNKLQRRVMAVMSISRETSQYH